jgi:hypothetical protein
MPSPIFHRWPVCTDLHQLIISYLSHISIFTQEQHRAGAAQAVLDIMGDDKAYAAHGLVNVVVDPSNPLLPSPWVSGSATLDVRSDLPLFATPTCRVRFEWCKHSGDRETFRRRAQFIALDTVDTAGTSSSAGTCKYTAVKQVLAWWDDDSGYWLVTEGEDGLATLQEKWAKIREDHKWSDVCAILVSVSEVVMVSCIWISADIRLCIANSSPFSLAKKTPLLSVDTKRISPAFEISPVSQHSPFPLFWVHTPSLNHRSSTETPAILPPSMMNMSAETFAFYRQKWQALNRSPSHRASSASAYYSTR